MFKLPKLKYEYDALEPYIDAKTMEIHHTKHHQTYVDKLNEALESLKTSSADKYDEIMQKVETDETQALEFLAKNLEMLPKDIRQAVQNNGGGHLNHGFFWQILTPGGAKPEGELLQAIEDKFGNLDQLKDEFKQAATGRFGSGWAWLAKDKAGELEVISTANQDSPLSIGYTPIFGLDVWEHAYYLKYQNKRPDYIDSFWQILDWQKAGQNYR